MAALSSQFPLDDGLRLRQLRLDSARVEGGKANVARRVGSNRETVVGQPPAILPVEELDKQLSGGVRPQRLTDVTGGEKGGGGRSPFCKDGECVRYGVLRPSSKLKQK